MGGGRMWLRAAVEAAALCALLPAVGGAEEAAREEAAATETVVLTPADNGMMVAVQREQEVMVRLPADPSTGAVWELDMVDTMILPPVAPGTFEPDDPVGEGRMQVFRYRGRAPGETPLWLRAVRPGGANPQTRQLFAVLVTVK